MKRVKQKKGRMPWKEAEAIAYGLNRMNARSAFAYAFNCDEKEITYGEFLFRTNPEDVIRLKDFDGYIELDKVGEKHEDL